MKSRAFFLAASFAIVLTLSSLGFADCNSGCGGGCGFAVLNYLYYCSSDQKCCWDIGWGGFQINFRCVYYSSCNPTCEDACRSYYGGYYMGSSSCSGDQASTCTGNDIAAWDPPNVATQCSACHCKHRITCASEYCSNGQCATKPTTTTFKTTTTKTTTTTVKTTTTIKSTTTTTYYSPTTTTVSSSNTHYYTCNTGPKAGKSFSYTDCDMSHIYPGSTYKVDDIDPSCVCKYQECNELLTQGYIRGGKVPAWSFGKEKWCQESCETLCKKYWGSQYEGSTCCGCQGSNPPDIVFGYNDEESGIWRSGQTGFCPEGNEDCYCKVRDATSCYLALTRKGLCELKDDSGKPVPVSGAGGTCYCDTDCCSRGDCCTDVELHCGHRCGSTTTTIKTSTTTPTTYTTTTGGYTPTTAKTTTTTGGSVTTTIPGSYCTGWCDYENKPSPVKLPNGNACFCDLACVHGGDCCPDACSVCGRCPGTTTTIKSSTTVKTSTTSKTTTTSSGCKPKACFYGKDASYSLHTPGTIASGENAGKAYWSGNCPYQSFEKCASGCNSVTGECKDSATTTIKSSTTVKTTTTSSSCRPRECSGQIYSLHTPGTIQQGPDTGKAYKIGNCIYGAYEKCANGCDYATGACRTATTTTLRPVSECPQSSCFDNTYMVYNPGTIQSGTLKGKSYKANSCPYQDFEECANGCDPATGACRR